MYPSGQWEGFWFQEAFGKQKMTAFTLRFANGDIVMLKQYIGKHRVLYRGKPDGEGCIGGTWNVEDVLKGPFLLKPVLQRPCIDEPIEEME